MSRDGAAAEADPDLGARGWGCENPKMTYQGFENRDFGASYIAATAITNMVVVVVTK